jgi:hypothetical protein
MAGQLTIDTLRAGSGVLATQNGMTGIAKAWVNFDGTTSPGTIRGSFNVSSVTRNSTGNYTVNFTTAMTANTFASCVTSGTLGTSYGIVQLGTQTTSGLTFGTFTPVSDAATNNANNGVAIFGA